MTSANTDEMAVLNYAPHDPQFISEEDIERADLCDALDVVIDLLEETKLAFNAIKDNFTTRKYNKYINALDEMKAEMEKERDDQDS